MAKITLSADSIGWGSGLHLNTDFTWDESGFNDTVMVTVKTVMSLKKAYSFEATPPVYVRVYRNGQVISTIKNSVHVKFNGASDSAYTLIDTTFEKTLARGYTYKFEMQYGPAYINGKNVGITTQTQEVYIPQAVDNNFTCSAAVVRTGTDNEYNTVDVSVSYSSRLEDSFYIAVAATADGATVAEDAQTVNTAVCKTDTSKLTFKKLKKNKRYLITWSVTQRGVTKASQQWLEIWSPPKINSFKVIGRTPNSLTIQTDASSPQGVALTYKYWITRDINNIPASVTSAATHTFEGLTPATHYYLHVDVSDTQKSTTSYTLSGSYTLPNPELELVAHEVTSAGFVKKEGVLYYCVQDNDIPRAVEKAAIIKDGSVVVIST